MISQELQGAVSGEHVVIPEQEAILPTGKVQARSEVPIIAEILLVAQVAEGQVRPLQEVDDLVVPSVRRPPIGDADFEIVERLSMKGFEGLEQEGGAIVLGDTDGEEGRSYPQILSQEHERVLVGECGVIVQC
jgi:hypothetical protein